MNDMPEIERTIRHYLNSSAGTCNWPTNHTLRCFIGMIEGNETDLATFNRIGGEWLSEQITEYAKEIGSVVL